MILKYLKVTNLFQLKIHHDMLVSNIFLTFFLLGATSCNGYRILAVFPFNGKNHHQVLQPIALELARKGHQVDVIGYFPLKQPVSNYTDLIVLPPAENPRMDYDYIVRDPREKTWLQQQKRRVCGLLGHPEISKLIRNPPTNPPYDLLLVHVLIGIQCFAAIGHFWNIPVAIVVTTQIYPHMHEFIGDPMNLAISTRHLASYKENMNFWERLHNAFKTRQNINIFRDFSNLHDSYIKKYISPKLPHHSELSKQTSLILSNSHFSYYGVKPRTPALVEIGGIHIRNDSNEYSPSVKKYLDESKHGFIYFSFGSMFAIETLPKLVLERFYASMRSIAPVRVIMRVPNPDSMPKNMPDNVLTFEWIPQQKVMQHPNIKAFVTHGGALGTQEAIYYKVPMICVPFFAEQYVNCDISSLRNISIRLDVATAQQEDYNNAFLEILYNPLYKKSIDKLSFLYRDRHQTPQEAVTYWIEYVIRHGKNVLRSPAVDLEWWQQELIDVYAFIIICAVTTVFAAIYILRLILRLFIRILNSLGSIRKKKVN